MYNPTEAKEIALEFLQLIGQSPSRANMSRTIQQVKLIMEANYSSEDIRYVMNDCIARVPDIYSFGYIARAMERVLANRVKEPEEYPTHVIEVVTHQVTSESEVEKEDDTTARNREKAKRLGVQSGKRAQSYLDMLEE